jgi:hypothetical protein
MYIIFGKYIKFIFFYIFYNFNILVLKITAIILAWYNQLIYSVGYDISLEKKRRAIIDIYIYIYIKEINWNEKTKITISNESTDQSC